MFSETCSNSLYIEDSQVLITSFKFSKLKMRQSWSFVNLTFFIKTVALQKSPLFNFLLETFEIEILTNSNWSIDQTRVSYSAIKSTPSQSPFCDMTLEKNNTHCQGIKLLRSFKRWRLEVGVDKNEVNCAWIIRINSAWNFPSRKMKPAKKGRGRHYSSLFGPDHTFKGRRPKFCSMTLFSTPSQQTPFQTSTI